MSSNHLPAWQGLVAHQHKMKNVHMRDLFASNPKRFQHFSICLEDLLFDYSKNRITEETMSLLLELAEQASLPRAIQAMFRGERINTTERSSRVTHSTTQSIQPAYPCRR